jgi:DNA polymerase III alpha subunit (gram-positive type)
MEFKANFVVLDCETGGLSAEKNPIVEISLHSFDIDLNDIKEYSSIIAPYGTYVIQPQALQANGLTMEQINGGKDSKIVLEEMISYFKSLKSGKEKPILIGHNLDAFDLNFLDEFFRFHKKDISEYVNSKFTVDTLWWSRLCWKESVNYQLGSCCENAGVTLVNAHRADTDTNATKQLVKHFIKNLRGQGSTSLKPESRFRATFQF